MRIFKIFAKNGNISYDHLRKIFDIIEFPLTEVEVKLMINFADENRDGVISASEFAFQVVHAKEIAP